MKVIVHGPNLTDSSEGTYRVHEASSPDNAREEKCNGSRHADEVEVDSRSAVIDHLFPENEYDREPDDLPMYLADVYFGESCDDLPLRAENPNEGEDTMADYTAEQKAEALTVYGEKESYRAVGRALSVSSETAKKIVVQAQEEAAAAAAAAKPATTRRNSGANVPAKEDANAMIPCRFCKDSKGHSIEHPATTEHWYVNKSTGELHSMSRCKTAERLYRQEKKDAKEAAAKKAAKGEAKAAKGDDRHLTAVA